MLMQTRAHNHQISSNFNAGFAERDIPSILKIPQTSMIIVPNTFIAHAMWQQILLFHSYFVDPFLVRFQFFGLHKQGIVLLRKMSIL